MATISRSLAPTQDRAEELARQAIALGGEAAWMIIEAYEAGELELEPAERRVAELQARHEAARAALLTQLR